MDDMQPIMTEYNAYKIWHLHARIHRTDGPAVIYKNGTKCWYYRGAFHRTDGPAVEYANGDIEWWLDGYWISFDTWLKQTNGLTDEEKVMYKLEHG
jgi:hypothetical protein